jgi:hypothetical protein
LPYDYDTAPCAGLTQLDGHRRELRENGFEVFDNRAAGNERDGRSRSLRRLSFVGTSESTEIAGADDMDGKPEGE